MANWHSRTVKEIIISDAVSGGRRRHADSISATCKLLDQKTDYSLMYGVKVGYVKGTHRDHMMGNEFFRRYCPRQFKAHKQRIRRQRF